MLVKDPSDSAMALIDVSFNASGLEVVNHLKMLAAAMVTILEPYQEARGVAGRLASIAITDIEKAAMVAVKAVTRPA